MHQYGAQISNDVVQCNLTKEKGMLDLTNQSLTLKE
jgi:hypothetical protein